jgi:hypothetical protein
VRGPVKEALVVRVEGRLAFCSPLIDGQRLVVGRAPEADVVLRGPGLPRQALFVTFEAGALWVAANAMAEVVASTDAARPGEPFTRAAVGSNGLTIAVGVSVRFERRTVADAVRLVLEDEEHPTMPLAARLDDDVPEADAERLFSRVAPGPAGFDIARSLRPGHADAFARVMAHHGGLLATLTQHTLDGSSDGPARLARLIDAWFAIQEPLTDPGREPQVRRTLRANPACVEVALLLKGLVTGKVLHRLDALLEPGPP